MQECRLGNDVYFQFRDRSISFDNGPLRSGAYGTLAAVQYVLHSMSDPEIADNPAALLLVRALAFTDRTMQLRHEYAQKPPQADPIEEDLRISAIETMETLKFEDDLHKTWYPIAKRLIGETYAPSPLDEELRNNIYAITTMSPIIAHSGDAWVRSRGLYYTVALNRSASSGHFIAGTKPSVLLGDIALGLQGRTTSRIEDEPVCLCALLGLDNTKVLQIPVPGPKEKRILSSINSRPTIAGLCRDGNKGILAAVVREAEGVVFTLFRATVERVLSEESIEAATVFSGRATWIAYPKWCVG
ncbi:MAG: hypothetical protein L6R36_009018 [Xanthoria steineri]|nr:MAG: hypothetical protein L6R36_009018 [Xanthoria steineri]